ncbi:MAG: hypothetical protein ABDH37_05625 [Candidatus Hydrothermales bacterium]
MFKFLLFTFISNGEFNKIYVPPKDLLKPCVKYAPSYISENIYHEFGMNADVLNGDFGFPRLISDFELSIPGKNAIEKIYNFLGQKGYLLGIDPKNLSL